MADGTSYQMTAYDINAENNAGALYGVSIEGLSMETKQSHHYGFATGLWRKDAFDTEYSLHLLSTEGEWKTYDFADYVEINGENAI